VVDCVEGGWGCGYAVSEAGVWVCASEEMRGLGVRGRCDGCVFVAVQ
jgi:hypothetical protein